ncbi:MAG: hypothetical protein CMJ83_21910 [Planctomycetes bacterium]|nr:hypothetical protein [Planctomycetota bacterium]
MQDDDDTVPTAIAVVWLIGLVRGGSAIRLVVTAVMSVAVIQRALVERFRRALTFGLMNVEPPTVLMNQKRPREHRSDQEQLQRRQRHSDLSDYRCSVPLLHGFHDMFGRLAPVIRGWPTSAPR